MRKNLNIRMLVRLIGGLLQLEAIFLLVPLTTCLIYGEQDYIVFALTCLCAAITGYLLWRVYPTSRRMGKREGFLLTASVWVVFSLAGMMPFIFGTPQVDVSTAFFEAMSGFTTTGATILPPNENISHGIIIWQAMMQWLGGMGIILFTLAIIPALNTSGGMQMFNAEVTGVTHDKIMPRISQTAKMLWGLYFGMTLLLTVLLWAGPMTLFDSICHAFGTISTGGFSSRAGSIAEFGSDYVLIVICLFMLLSGMNFAMLFKAATGRWRLVKHDEVTCIYIYAILVFTALFAIGRFTSGNIHDWRDCTILPLFQVVSSITSTGYLAPGFTIWEPFILALTFIMMFSGGCAGSTSGGAKIDRLLYMGRFLGNELHLCTYPNSIKSVRINGKIVNRDVVAKVVAFLCIFMLLIVAGGTALSFMGLPAVDSFFSSFSCICNTGFGASLTGYGDDFLAIPAGAKWVLSFLMLTGRLEIFTIIVLFTPSFWK